MKNPQEKNRGDCRFSLQARETKKENDIRAEREESTDVPVFPASQIFYPGEFQRDYLHFSRTVM